MNAGSKLGPYEIRRLLGEGGMGAVYQARDTRLGRDVALKILPADFADNADRLRRFEQEAKTLATLNHPNILTIHDVGVHDGAPYLVSEVLEGRTLRDDLANGPLSVRKAMDYALQIALGLAAAHGGNIIHRDLKPENLFVTKDGRVKILDFGLAKLRAPEMPPTGPDSGSPLDPDATTRVEPAIESTESGKVMGTPSYMAPEQVRAERVDHRADIFAFGCVLYEMLSGQGPFRKGDAVTSMSAILNDDPPELSELKPRIPAALSRAVHRCLEKNPENRFQTAKDLAFALETIAAAKLAPKEAAASVERQQDRSDSRPVPTTPVGATNHRRAWGFALPLIAAGIGWWLVNQSGNEAKKNTQLATNSHTTSPASAPAAEQKSVAVLPFVNMSTDKIDEYLSDGMTEELINVLAKLPGLRVPDQWASTNERQRRSTPFRVWHWSRSLRDCVAPSALAGWAMCFARGTHGSIVSWR
jgi:serine/threonine protein kinase